MDVAASMLNAAGIASFCARVQKVLKVFNARLPTKTIVVERQSADDPPVDVNTMTVGVEH